MMKLCRRASLTTLLLALAPATVLAQSACDRNCLRNALDSYLHAVTTNTPESAPLAYAMRQTENAVNVPVGAGVWQSVTALGDVQRRYFDPVSGQAAYYGGVMEGEEGALVTVRVRVENDSITEAEWYIARANDPGMRGERKPGEPPANLLNLDYLKRNGPPQRTVPTAERADRDTLIRIADSYFDALTSHDRTVAMVHPGCGRAENGSPAPGGQFLPPLNPDQARTNGEVRDCLAGLENFDLSMVVARRIPLVDVEAQAVLSYGVFIRRPGSSTPRNVFSEWFFIEQAKIRTVYTSMFYPPATLAVPNWPPYEGHWPLPAEIGSGGN
ncbi:MAG: hypothetical protein H6978_06260 [Gammaproteobacteria bacterium]|nr:hypothetical protein [Gammaproteobacteria bacterium]